MARPVIALLSDFGAADHYSGTMKGVILGICPEATLVDITHEVPPHDVETAAHELAACYHYFPPATVFLVVVDPGVGSGRRALAAEAGDYRFVAPDNGVLSAVFAEVAPRVVIELTERQYARPTVSRTFEGRDRFAPAAAWLARGVKLSALGRPAGGWHALALAELVEEGGTLTGVVVRVDRFGNLISNIDRRAFERLGAAGSLEIRAGDRPVARLVSTYGDIAPGEAAALFGSSDHLEIAAQAGSAAAMLGLGRGARVTVRRA